MTENFLQVNVRHQTTDPGNSQSNTQDKCQKTTPKPNIIKLQKIKDKEKILKEARRGNKHLTYRGTKNYI